MRPMFISIFSLLLIVTIYCDPSISQLVRTVRISMCENIVIDFINILYKSIHSDIYHLSNKLKARSILINI